MIDKTILWQKCLKLIFENEYLPLNPYKEFLLDTQLESLKDGFANIVVEDEVARQTLIVASEKIEKALLEVTETNFKARFYIIEELEDENNENIQLNILYEDNLNHDFTFENYVIGPSNKDSYRASIAIADQPGKIFNPLFIYGNTGLGKSHLAHAIGNQIKANRPNLRILYVSSSQFENDFTSIYKDKNKENAFYQKYNDLDVLIIDDIQLLGIGEKVKTKNHFFNIYNDLYTKNKQIIIISDVRPEDLNGIEDRLISRFNQGLKTQIFPPEFETSLAILKKKISVFEKSELNISEPALEYIAKNFSKDVRSLEGTLKTILLYSTNNHIDNQVNLDIVKEIFKDDIQELCDGNITQKNIMDVVCKYYNVSKSQIISKQRQRSIAIPRQIAIYLTRNLLNIPYEKIGEIYGNRDHSTIMNSYNKIRIKIEKKEGDFVLVINELIRLLKKN